MPCCPFLVYKNTKKKEKFVKTVLAKVGSEGILKIEMQAEHSHIVPTSFLYSLFILYHDG